MSLSVAEITALAVKAARGAGAPAGQAARFGPVAALHLAKGRDPDLLMHALRALPAGPIIDIPLDLDDSLCRAARDGSVHMASQAPEDLLRSYCDALPFATRLSKEGSGGLRLAVSPPSEGTAEPLPRIDGCDELVVLMTHLAEATFVPESSASRISGAGAGLSDND